MINYTLKSQSELSSFNVFFRGAASAETPQLRGVSHLLEHLICNRLEDLKKEMHRYSLDFNGGTSDEYVRFHIAGLDEYVLQFKDRLLEQLTTRYVFTEEELENERKIVLQEIAQINTDTRRASAQLLKQTLFDHYGPAGDPEVIEKVTLQEVQDFYEKLYAEPCATYLVSRSVEPGQDGQETPAVLPICSTLIGHPSVAIPELPDPKSFFAVGPVIPSEEQPLSQMIAYMLCGELDKPLYHRLRKELCLCYSVGISQFEIDGHYVNIIRSHMDRDKFALAQTEICKIMEEGAFLTRENYEDTMFFFRIMERLNEAQRFGMVYDLLFCCLGRPGEVSKITYERLVEHYNRYFRPYATLFRHNA